MRSAESTRVSTGLRPGGRPGQPRNIHVAIGGERQRARNGRRRHHQHIGGLFILALQLHALMHAEAMLLIHDRKAQIAKRNVFGKQCMRADQNIDLALGQVRSACRTA